MRIQVLRAAIWDRASMRARRQLEDPGKRVGQQGLEAAVVQPAAVPMQPEQDGEEAAEGVLSRGMPMVRLTWPASGGRAVSTVGARSAEGSTMATRSRDRSPAFSRMCRTYWACRVRELQVIIRHSRPPPSPRVASAIGWGRSPHWPSGTISRMKRPASIRLRT